MKEQRKFPRVNLTGKIIWRRDGDLDNLDVIKNISEGGLCFETNDLKLVSSDIVQFDFQLPNTKTIHSKARVCWVGAVEPSLSGWQAGFEFQDISDANRQDIRLYVGECRYGCE